MVNAPVAMVTCCGWLQLMQTFHGKSTRVVEMGNIEERASEDQIGHQVANYA